MSGSRTRTTFFRQETKRGPTGDGVKDGKEEEAKEGISASPARDGGGGPVGTASH